MLSRIKRFVFSFRQNERSLAADGNFDIKRGLSVFLLEVAANDAVRGIDCGMNLLDPAVYRGTE